MVRTNEYGQPVGEPVPGWVPAPVPEAPQLAGRYCRLEVLDVDLHADQLYEAYAQAPDDRDWTYLDTGPYPTRESYREWAKSASTRTDPRHYAVIDVAAGVAVGTLALLRHDAVSGVIEVGWVMFSPRLRRTPISTEAQFLLMAYVFEELGYRRYEWKCDSLNEPSKNAALRLGFHYEGTFRNNVVYKGRNRDTAWYSIIAPEWPRLKAGFLAWLEPTNFDGGGQQLSKLHSSDADSCAE
ncbi:GNAT family N-acetyltransferase [Leucobacter luti]|uniref:GNAT family N-acetyltransferase n=1 Tax=Leucobacter luti TaxID=340320 RepID=UPI00215D78BD|nr:GNAT family protein [Leucobacter luti]